MTTRIEIARKHRVLILPQNQAIAFKPVVKTNLIRIMGWNPTGIDGFAPLQCKDKFNSILELHFDDVDQRVEEHNKVINGVDAYKIVDFFEEHVSLPDSDKLLVIHCQGGISRSSAVACAYAVFLNNPELEADIRSCGLFVPNARVYREIVNEIKTRRDEPSFWINDTRVFVESEKPSSQEIDFFLDIINKAFEFEALSRSSRGYGAFSEKEVESFPNQTVIKVIDWLKSEFDIEG